MAFRKGKSGNPNGRPKGAGDKKNETLRKWVEALLDNNREVIEDDLKKLSPPQRVKTLLRLLDYVIPRMQSVSARIDFDMLSDEQLDSIINVLSEKYDDESEID